MQFLIDNSAMVFLFSKPEVLVSSSYYYYDYYCFTAVGIQRNLQVHYKPLRVMNEKFKYNSGGSSRAAA